MPFSHGVHSESSHLKGVLGQGLVFNGVIPRLASFWTLTSLIRLFFDIPVLAKGLPDGFFASVLEHSNQVEQAVWPLPGLQPGTWKSVLNACTCSLLTVRARLRRGSCRSGLCFGENWVNREARPIHVLASTYRGPKVSQAPCWVLSTCFIESPQKA